jgi:glutamine---fructose-6-phosphate transaminase (isomerizing)
MNNKEEKYTKFALTREMMETPGIIRNFDPLWAAPYSKPVSSFKGLFLTGEGSSRIFPAKRAISYIMKRPFSFPVLTEGATQSLEYNLKDLAVFASSNSGQTKEVIKLAEALKKQRHPGVYGLTASKKSRLEEFSTATHVLSCGKEQAVAATKSVVEQGLFYDALVRLLNGEEMDGLKKLADQTEEALSVKIDPAIIQTIKNADVIYFAGRNNGVAEELALKTNEITRKKSAYLEGTFAVHGIEEVMNKNEVLIWIDPFEDEQTKFIECLIKGVGMNIIAISSKPTMLPTITIPDGGEYAEYVQLAAGWNVLVETGISLGIDLDKPTRARKVGNEYLPG